MFECIFSQRLMHKIFNLILDIEEAAWNHETIFDSGQLPDVISESYSYDRRYECIVKAIYEVFDFKVPTWSHTRLKFIQNT